MNLKKPANFGGRGFPSRPSLCVAPQPGSEQERGLEAASTSAMSWLLAFPRRPKDCAPPKRRKRRPPCVRKASDAKQAPPSWRGRIIRRVLETPDLSCSQTIPSANKQDAVTNPAISTLSERVARCSLSPGERVRVRGYDLNVSIQISEIETRAAMVSLPIRFQSSGFAPRIGIIQ
jgi:hypothetical protein